MNKKRKKILLYAMREKMIRCTDKIFHGYLQKASFYNKRKILEGVECQDFISHAILSGRPFMAGRFGSVELRCMIEYEQISCGMRKEYSDHTYVSMKRNAGFFPTKRECFEQFADRMISASRQVDLLGIWYNNLESYYVDQYLPDARLTRLGYLEPCYFENPWSRTLEGKRVLVIHPFIESIKKQYKKREYIFNNSMVLPEFELLCYKAIQTFDNIVPIDFQSWFEALEFMHEEIKKIDYDVAIVGCGAYGFPLAAMIKEDGKQAIHLGGATQIMFGIKGKRWDTHPLTSKLYNEYWIRPSDNEKITNIKNVENGCYW